MTSAQTAEPVIVPRVRAHRILGCSAAVVSLAAITAVLALASPGQPVAAILVLAMAWGAAPQAIDALVGRPAQLEAPKVDAAGSVTIVVVTAEPTEAARVSMIAAANAAPTVIVTVDPQVTAALGPLPIPMIEAKSVEEGLNRAAAMAETDALLVLSDSSFPDVASALAAAGLIRAGFGWVVGQARTFNGDGFAPLVRDRLIGRLRSEARTGGVPLWEPDATMVSVALVRQHPFTPGQPWGATLRTWSDAGAIGGEYDLTLSARAVPVDARSFWPASVLRQRRSVVELADAARTRRGRRRLLPIGLLLRELAGSLLAVWLLMPWLVTTAGSSPFRCAPWLIVILVAVPAALRWATERRVHGLDPHPLDDALALAFDAPGSVLALPSVVTRRAAPTRVPLPGQPLVWAALAFAATTLVPLLSDGTTAERGPAIGLALTEIALLWLFAMRALFQRNWARRTYRVRDRLPALLDGRPVTTLDLSPTGLALEGELPQLVVGSAVAIEVSLGDGSTLRTGGTVAGQRRRNGADVVGVALLLPADERTPWIDQLCRSATLGTEAAALERQPRRSKAVGPRRLVSRWLARALVALIVLISATALMAVAAAAVGYRPLIVRSGSMVPALRIGDVVLVEEITVRELRVGDIATLHDPNSSADTITHRVRLVATDGTQVVLTTRGDANVADETFTMASDAIVGRVVHRLPGLGSALAWTAGTWSRQAAGALAAAVLVVVLVRTRWHRARRW